MAGPRLTALADSLPATVPFVGPEEHERRLNDPLKARLGANESVFGPSPDALAAMREAAEDAWKYPDSQSHELRQALSRHLGIGPDHIVVGAGIDGLLGSLVRMTVAPGDPVTTSAGAYPTFNYHVAGYGGVLHTVPYQDDHEDPQALLEKAKHTGAKLVYLANPDNPMGSWHASVRIAETIRAVPEGTLLVLDEAYLECGGEHLAPPLDPGDPRVIRMRTFSKAYGLAGARIGYAIGHPHLIAAFHKVRNHFGVSRISQAGATAALKDATYLSDIKHKIAVSRDRIAAIARASGLRPLPSATNFVAVDLGGDGALTRRAVEALMRRGIFTRMPGVAPLDRCLRISCGTPRELDLLETALPEVLSEIR